MYLRTVRGERWIPSLSKSSLAMRSSPPTYVIASHLPDECPKLRGYARASTTTLPTPEQPKACSVPTNQRLRCDIHQGIPPGKKPREKYQQIA